MGMRNVVLLASLLLSGCCGAYDGGGDHVYARNGSEMLILCGNGGFVANLTSSTIEGRYMTVSGDGGTAINGPDGELEVQFGWYHFRTPMSTVASWQIEGPWLWITAIGLRMSIRHHDVTFGGSPHGGVRIDFTTPVRWTIFRVPAIYVPADDLNALAAELARRGVPGRDLRRPRG